ncbi:MAG TPA: hypothetical protein VGK94_10470 [Candidatus Polarisedimenticolia bacterium]|jgi:hypothetical protein
MVERGLRDDEALRDHLAACSGCLEERDRLERLATLLALEAPRLHVDGGIFEARLMREIRSRTDLRPARRDRPTLLAAWSSLKPASLGAALCLMAAAGALALVLQGQPVPSTSVPAGATVGASSQADVDDDDGGDLVTPPREIPFTVERDLVGARRGTIPLTTYVLEPAPDQTPVMRASL